MPRNTSSENGVLIVEIGHNRDALEAAYPELPFTWLDVAAGDEFVFMLHRERPASVCSSMPVDHYENFPVASILLPKRLRKPVAAIYHFARRRTTSPMKAICPTRSGWQRLDKFRAELARIADDTTPLTPLFIEPRRRDTASRAAIAAVP